MSGIIKVLNHIRPLLSLHVLPYTIWFNYRYLPLSKALKLPIWLYKANIQHFSGSVKLMTNDVWPGMIRLGFRGGRAFPNNGIVINVEGKIIFEGKCQIGNNSAIIIGKNGKVIFGNGFLAPTSLKIFSYCGIRFGKKSIFGWDCIIQDTNFYPLYDLSTSSYRKGFGKISIGDDNWFSQGCLILPGVNTPERCIFAARSLVTKNSNFNPYCVHGGNPLKILVKNVQLNYQHYMITDYSK